MATIGTDVTLMDMRRRWDDNDKIAKIVELMVKQNEVLQDMVVVEANQTTSHVTTVRSGLPTAVWRQLNYGVQPSKSTTKQVTDSIGMLEAYAEVDKALADLNGNTAAFRLSEDRAFLEAMNQEMASTLFYGNTTLTPEKFMGIAPRYATGITAETGSGHNIITCAADDSDNTSIYLVVWGDNTVHGTFPKGSKAGFSHSDLGEVTLDDGQTPAGRYQGYRSHYKWDLGFVVRDWRYIVRIANIDVTLMKTDAATKPNLVNAMTTALELIPNLGAGRPTFYCNRDVRMALRRQIRATTNVNLTFDSVAGHQVLAFDGYPVRRSDAILNTEAVVGGSFNYSFGTADES